MKVTHALSAALLLALALPAAAQPIEETLDFKKLMERGEYEALARKLKPYLDLERADPRLKRYLEMNLEYLARGAKPAQPGSELILVRGAGNDKTYKMPATSGGSELFLPNSIRYMRTSWDKRLPRISKYFSEATTLMGGEGKTTHNLEKIIEHHKGGGLGTSANSVKSVLISTSTQPLHNFGPPYYILKVAPERAIFNWKGLSGEREVLIPFYILPHEIVAKVNSYQEVLNHPLYQQSKLKDVSPHSYGYNTGGGSGNNWEIIENNIRNGRPPLEGVAGLNSYFPGDRRTVGPLADAEYLRRFVDKVEKLGGVVEYVGKGDLRLPTGAQARTYLDSQGRPHVLLRRGEVPPKIALLDELTHVHQLARMLKAQGRKAVEEILMRARMGDLAALDVVNRFEIRAKKLIRSMIPKGDSAHEALSRSILVLEAELDPYAATRRSNGTIDWKRAGRQFGTGMAHFTLALFLKELALVSRTGDTLLIQEFFDGLATTDFYVHYGLFSLGAAGADLAYAAYLEKHVAKYVRPQFVRSVLRSQVSLAVGMALPDLIMGRFEGRTFAISLAGLGLSSTAVKAGVAGIKWVSSLKNAPNATRLTTYLARANKLRKVGGFLYHAAETAVVLYYGDQISREIDTALTRRAAKEKVRAAVDALLADPKGEGAKERANAVAAAYREYRDFTARSLQEAESLLLQRLERLGTQIKQNQDALNKVSSSTPALRERAERLAKEREEKVAADMKRAIDAYDAAFAAARDEVYDATAKAEGVPTDDDALWVLRGSPSTEGLGRNTSWFGNLHQSYNRRRVVNAAADLEDSRLAVYDQEANLWDALAKAHADDPAAAFYYASRARGVRDSRDADRAVVTGQRTGTERTAADDDKTLRGFVETLNEMKTPGE